ncbi:hypothetical protein CAPTEDRAFT_189892 [Capitella teleta]|uniref:HTH OST-type domain-containing protein n=1 Tax=Capitella teleta TaxID=283909 RepID=R7TR04_CAPTE|nr:hypothetical protein CAPTEDRAFT_189892 [Capitella teleta]|eukprot:ELT96318.1 hypothetical protein CAPTEDRAFT_189892 [Capitella teleta]
MVGLFHFLEEGSSPKSSSANDVFKAPSKTAILTLAEELYARLFAYEATDDDDDFENDDAEENETDIAVVASTSSRVELEDSHPQGSETFTERLQSFVQQSSSMSSTDMTQRQKSQNSRPPIKKDVTFFEATGELSEQLKKLRNALLTIKPSSVEAERAFSTTGKFLTRFRPSMEDEHISQRETDVDLWLDGLPESMPIFPVRQRLKQLSDNCGGKVVAIGSGSALLRFSSLAAAQRAKIRLHGEHVFGYEIEVSFNDLHSQMALKKRKKDLKKQKPDNPQCSLMKHDEKRKIKRKRQSNHTKSPRPEPLSKNPQPSSYSRGFYRMRSETVSSDDLQKKSERISPRKSPQTTKNLSSRRQASDSPQHSHNAPYWNINFGQDKLGHSDPSLEMKPGRHYQYLEEQLYNSCFNSDELFFDNSKQGCSREECHSAPLLTWKTPSPGHPHRFPNFRRTPGASRPNSRNSYVSTTTSTSARSTPAFGGFDGKDPQSFRPIRPSPAPLLTASDLGSTDGEGDDLQGVGVEVMISNLDYNISGREWRKILYAEFHQHVQILAVYVQAQPDNTSIGFVKVPTVDDARYLISQFHRKKIGYKRIHVSLVNSEHGAATNNIKSEVTALLREVSGQRMPLFKFIELYEKRYYRGISVPDLFRLKDTVDVVDVDGSGRQVLLLPTGSGSPIGNKSSASQDGEAEVSSVEWPVCKTHCPEDSAFYVEAMDATNLPFVQLQLKGFAAQVHTLMQTHNGSLPLMSFPACYASEFGSLNPCTQNGVPLEHLISCVPGVKVALVPSGIKKVQWAENKNSSPAVSGPLGSSPSLGQQLTQFSSELIDLLKSSPQCRMPFSKFIPSYHHHFGKQCRVADYGYTRLMELFDSMPHTVQVLGSGNRRYITLAHRTQIKRFATDLLRVLRTQSSKQVSILMFPSVYQKVFSKSFDIYEYGVCYLEDLLCELEDNTIVVKGTGKEMTLGMPVREMEKSLNMFASSTLVNAVGRGECVFPPRSSDRCKLIHNASRFIIVERCDILIIQWREMM